MSTGGRLVVKVHRRVPLAVAEDPLIIEEIVARKKAAADIAGRLNAGVLVIRQGRAEALVEELRQMGHTPRVQGK